MSFGTWIKRLFGSTTPDDEAALREEVGVPDRGKESLRSGEFSSLDGEEAGAGEDELEGFKAPPDPAP
jgi:hypothetical protein